MPITLTDTHLVILSAAAADTDQLVPATIKLRGNVRAATHSLVKAGYVEIVSVARDGPVHGTDTDGHLTGLQITPAGLCAIGLGAVARDGDAKEPDVGGGKDSPLPERRSKRNRVVDLLRREEGVTLAELRIETSWLPHTVRAALSGPKTAGLAVARVSDEYGQSRYRIVVSPIGDGATAVDLTVEA